jgi:hypothetical protein
MFNYSEEPNSLCFLKRWKHMLNAAYMKKKLDPHCEINKHIVILTKLLYIFTLAGNNDVRRFSNNRACVIK